MLTVSSLLDALLYELSHLQLLLLVFLVAILSDLDHLLSDFVELYPLILNFLLPQVQLVLLILPHREQIALQELLLTLVLILVRKNHSLSHLEVHFLLKEMVKCLGLNELVLLELVNDVLLELGLLAVLLAA